MWILFFLFFIPQILSYNVLFLAFHDSGSHQGSMSKLFLKLAKSGNNVTVFDTTSKKSLPDYGFSNIKVIDGKCNYVDKFGVLEMWWKTSLSSTDLALLFNMGDLFLEVLINEKSNILLEILNVDYDAIIIDDLFTVHGFYFIEILRYRKKIPIIQYGTSYQLSALQSARAHHSIFFNEPANAGFLPKTKNDVFNPKNFYSRLVNFYTKSVELFITPFLADNYMETLNKLIGRQFSLKEFYRQSSLVFTEAFNGFGLPLSKGNDIFAVGSHCPKIGTIDEEMLTFINDPESKGTIVLAFGSNVKWNLAPKRIINAFFGAFEELTDYRIIFSYNGKPRKVPKHVKLSPWMQQKEIVNHPKTKMLIGHSGLKSTNEAICAAVPLIFMPSFADQKYNSEFFVHLGYAEILNKHYMTKQLILEAIYEILNNFEVKKSKMEKLRSIYMDKLIQPMDLAEFYVNRSVKTFKNNGKVVFERKGVNLGWIDYSNLDLFFGIFILFWIVWK